MPIGLGHDIIGDQTTADAILDRLVNVAHPVELKVDFLRRKKSPEKEDAEN